ncbi:SAVED domain-containing protein [Bacillus nitratireducens]|uniref:SAVED domain-containing protein n=1 Tax=Bacillus nitratireducens TaxID=2026193 RepID=UPI001BADB92A|nr:SAVED domain-containing protein [Bacillus nitratireducens]QUG82483.1 SAVED domain-containing protein [Bacillus nitratireducens]
MAKRDNAEESTEIKEQKRRQLATVENYQLWVNCGGICSFEGCDKRLIASEGGNLTNNGIKAHIIGHAKTAPRREYMEKYDYTEETLENLSNLMLMCTHHAKLIDDKHTKDQYPPDLLFEMKRKHEDWVRSWSEKKKKKSIALIHKRLGGPITNIDHEGEAPYILLDAIENQDEFINFTKEGWEEGKKINRELHKRFKEKISESEANVAEVFPLSPIPLLIDIGFLLTDTVPLSVYQFEREEGVWVSDHPDRKKEVELTSSADINGEDKLAILVSVSGKVKMKDVQESLGDKFDSVSFEINDPGLKRVLYKQDVSYIQSQIKEEVEKLLQEQDYRKIHLFYAGPAGLAIELGRGINPNIWVEVCVYQYNVRATPHYQYALSI